MSTAQPAAPSRPSIFNPGRFAGIAGAAVPWLAAATAVAFAVGLYLGLWASPEDYQQGSTVRIMYVHVPSAWLAMLAYIVMSSAALGTLVWRHPLADVAGRCAAPIGAVFTLVALATGSIWGKPMWGAWWVWDMRLTSMLVLFFIYLGLIALGRAIDEPGRAARIVAIATLVGLVNIPIIKFSVEWWSTLHQGASVITLEGPKIDPSMLRPLLIMAVAFTLLFLTLHLSLMRSDLIRRRARAIRMRTARGAA